MGQSGIAMAAEIALQDTAIRSAVENRAPCFQLTHAGGSFFGMQFGHAPTVQVLATAHGVCKMNAPGIAIIHVGESGGDSAFGHNRVSLAKQRLRDDSYTHASGGGFGGSAQTGAARSDHKNVMLVG